MTRSVYIIGGAATGKSTFTAELLSAIGSEMGPLTDLHTKPNARGSLITLRGHHVGDEGLYIGCMRDSFPGTDGLDRASSISGEAWLESGGHESFSWIVAEGATLATRRFIGALHEHTELLLVHLWADPFVKELRCLERGSEQAETFIQGTATRSLNLWAEMKAKGVPDLDVDTADPGRWSYAIGRCLEHVLS